ncbi:transcriptional regulator swi6, partial [Lunasporangiospora selenospora]
MDISNIIYQAVYSGVPVYEVMCRGINVMRRREDSCLNATQILKVAGIEKGKRTKILEREVLTGDHEKVQGGYGKYQGTWVPLQRGVDLARQYKVEPLLRLLFEFEIPPGEDLETPTKDMVHARIRKRRIIRRSSISSSPTTSPTAMRSQMPHLQHHQHHAHMSGLQHPGQEPFHYPPPSMTPSPLHPSFSASSPSVPPSPQWYMEHPPRKRHKTTTTPPPLHSFDDDFSPRQHFIHNSHGYPYQGQYLHNPRYGQDRGPTHVYNPYPSPQRPYPPPPMPSPLSQSPHALKAQQQQQQLQHPPPPTFHHYHQQQYPPSHQPHQPQPPPYSQQRPQQQYLHSTYDSEGSRPQLYPSWGSQGPIEYYRATLMGIFLNEESDPVPDLLLNPNPPSDFDIDLVIDDQGHTALHWAAALARIRILDILTKRRANVQQVNVNGETALIRAVMVTNNFDRQSFAHLVRVLRESIPVVDKKNRTVLHHIAITASIRTREAGARYYMECLLEWIARNGGDFSMVDIQDKNGDTALTIAARVGDRYLVRMLLDIGANPEIENKVGLKAGDFGFDNGW